MKKHPANQKRRLASRGGLMRSLNRKRSLSPSKYNNREFDPNDPLVVGHRKVIMEGPVQLCVGSSIKDRCMFLYNDLLVIAKQKSQGKYNLKDRIRLTEVWLNVDDLMTYLPDLICLHNMSFVIGWPNAKNNFVAIFTSKNIRDIWYQILFSHIHHLRTKEKSVVPLKITMQDEAYSVTKSLLVNNRETANELVERCVIEFRLVSKCSLNLELHVSCEPDHLTTRKLRGFEIPHYLHSNFLRKKSSNLNSSEIKFLLKNKEMIKSETTTKSTKKSALRQKLSKCNSQSSGGQLFGRDLSELISKDNHLCDPLMKMLEELYVHGPVTTGVFRRTGSYGMKNVKMQLDAGEIGMLEEVLISDMAALLKEFLRCMPDCLLMSSLYSEWMHVASAPMKEMSVSFVRSLIFNLPSSHNILLQHLLCILKNISQHSDINLMTSYNIAVCISQCLLWPMVVHDNNANSSPALNNTSLNASHVIVSSPTSSTSSLDQLADIGKMNLLVQFLIDNVEEIFGSDCLKLFNHLREKMMSQVSGSSCRALLSQKSTDSDSSQSSLTSTPQPKSSHKSVKNLNLKNNESQHEASTMKDSMTYTYMYNKNRCAYASTPNLYHRESENNESCSEDGAFGGKEICHDQEDKNNLNGSIFLKINL